MPRKFPAPPFHYEIWTGPTQHYGSESKAIEYVENHNSQCGYAEIATDYSIAANTLLETYAETQTGNWMAPTAFLIRQTLELQPKALLEAICDRDKSESRSGLRKHKLLTIWDQSYRWLTTHGYKISEDARLSQTIHLLQAYDSIDPTGDLFRFGISNQSWFGKQKSYDRAGINIEVMQEDFGAAEGLLNHWEAVVFRKSMMEEMGSEVDAYFDPDDFPK